MKVQNVEQDELSLSNPGSINEEATDNDHHGDRRTETQNVENDNPSQPLPPTPSPHSRGDATPGEDLEPGAAVNEQTTPRAKWNNKSNAKHWCLTLNNYNEEDLAKFKQAFANGETEVNTAIIGKEVGTSGTPHLQGYIAFKTKKRQSGVHAFFGYDEPRMHLSVQGKEGPSKGKPPLAAFRYCMKDNDYYVIGTNLDEEARLKKQTQAGTGRCSDNYKQIQDAIEKGEIDSMAGVRRIDAEAAARSEDYWRGLIVQSKRKPPVKPHSLRRWQEMLLEKLEEPFSDREVVFVIDKVGNCGKSWFTVTEWVF